jgi:HdeA/HdeB family
MRMHTLAVGASLAFVVAASHAAHAVRIDMSKMTCRDCLQAKDPGGANLMWMSGYFAGKAGETIFDTDRHIRAARQLGYLCRSNPNALVIEIYRRALADNSGNL